MRLNLRACRVIRGALLVLCVACVGFAAYELLRPYHLPPAAPPDPDEPAAIGDGPTGNPGDVTVGTAEDATGRPIPPLSTLSEIVERPLFMAGRTPLVAPVPAPKPAARPTATSEQVLLSAVVITDEQRVALVYTDRDDKLHQLRPGEIFKGWTLTEVRPEGMFLKQGPRERYIELAITPSRPAARARRGQAASGPADGERVEIQQPDEISDDRTGSRPP